MGGGDNGSTRLDDLPLGITDEIVQGLSARGLDTLYLWDGRRRLDSPVGESWQHTLGLGDGRYDPTPRALRSLLGGSRCDLCAQRLADAPLPAHEFRPRVAATDIDVAAPEVRRSR